MSDPPTTRKKGSGRPARGYSWPPFQPGNVVALKHGASSERAIEAKAAEVRATLLDVAPWVNEPAFMPAVARYLRAEARALLLHRHIEQVAAEKGTGAVPTRVWENATAADRLAAQLGNVLGLDPLGRARVQQVASQAAVNVATLGELATEGRRLRLAAEARLEAAERTAEEEDQ